MEKCKTIIVLIIVLVAGSVVNVSAQRHARTSSARAAYGDYEIISPVKHKANAKKKRKPKKQKVRKSKPKKDKQDKALQEKNSPYRRRSGWAG